MHYLGISLRWETFNFNGFRQETYTLVFRIEAHGFYKLSCYWNSWIWNAFVAFLKSGCLGGKNQVCIVTSVSSKNQRDLGVKWSAWVFGSWRMQRWPRHPARTVAAAEPLPQHNCFSSLVFRPSPVHRPAVFDQRFLYRSRSVCL